MCSILPVWGTFSQHKRRHFSLITQEPPETWIYRMSETEEAWRIISSNLFILHRGTRGWAQNQMKSQLLHFARPGLPGNLGYLWGPFPCHFPRRWVRGQEMGESSGIPIPPSKYSVLLFISFTYWDPSKSSLLQGSLWLEMFKITIVIYHYASLKKISKVLSEHLTLLQIAQTGVGWFSLFYKGDNWALAKSSDLIYKYRDH